MNVIPPPYALYPEARHWWSLRDYGAVLGVMRELQPKTVLEFGPGSSTLALLEGGATHIDTCEDHPDWAKTYRERLVAKRPDIVTLHDYTWSDPLRVPSLAERRYDLAFIDGPYTSEKRPPVIAFCLQRCAAVLVPTEDDGRKHKSYLRPYIEQLAAAAGYGVEYFETGPLSGGFALLTPRSVAAPTTDTAGLGSAEITAGSAEITLTTSELSLSDQATGEWRGELPEAPHAQPKRRKRKGQATSPKVEGV